MEAAAPEGLLTTDVGVVGPRVAPVPVCGAVPQAVPRASTAAIDRNTLRDRLDRLDPMDLRRLVFMMQS